MRKLLVLLGLVLIPLGFGSMALAQSGSDSSGTHSYSLECVGEDLVVTNTGVGRIRLLVQLAMGQPAYTLGAGESRNLGEPGIDTGPAGTYFEIYFEDPDGSDSFHGLDSGTFPDCADDVPDVAPALISECRGTGWYLVHPGGNFAYRMGTGDILYPAGYTSNNPAALYGEAAIDAGVNEVGTADDFNNVATYTRPAECGGPPPPTTEPPTTEPPTTEPTTEPTTSTTEPTVPGEPVPNTPGLAPVVAEGFVAPGAHIGPGMATFGVTGFVPGEQVTVTLFSTPRELGTVTADASGTVSITFEVLASDGAGEHRVQFSGPSGTASVPFTLVLPAQSLPVTR